MKLKKNEIDLIQKKTNNRCCICGTWQYLQIHHIIFRSQGGSNNYENLVLLCNTCHYQIHHGLKSKEYQEQTYKYLTKKDNYNNCWKGLYEPKIIRRLKNDKL